MAKKNCVRSLYVRRSQPLPPGSLEHRAVPAAAALEPLLDTGDGGRAHPRLASYLAVGNVTREEPRHLPPLAELDELLLRQEVPKEVPRLIEGLEL